jgi:ferredoxin
MSVVLRIDPTRCRGHAVCALFHPDGIELDPWGYGTVVEAGVDDRRSARRAARAVAACPNGALLMMDTVEGTGVGGPEGTPIRRPAEEGQMVGEADQFP